MEINDSSTIDNLITITRIDCNNGNLENNDEFNIPPEIVVNDNKETQTTNNCEYVTTNFFDTFYVDSIDFKRYINDIINILNERKVQLNVIERLTENQNSDIRTETGNELTTVRHNKNSKGSNSRQNKVPELQNLHSPLQVEDLPQQILVEENNSTVLPKERNTNLDNVIRRRPNI